MRRQKRAHGPAAGDMGDAGGSIGRRHPPLTTLQSHGRRSTRCSQRRDDAGERPYGQENDRSTYERHRIKSRDAV